MSNVSKSTQVSLVSLILPKESLDAVCNAVNSAGATGIFQVTARGSVLSEGGLLNRFFPPPAPEQLLLQALVPNGRVKEVTEAAIKAGHLDRVGSGAVFTIDCNDAFFSQSFPGAHSDDQDDSQEVGSGDLEAICCICEKGIADDIARAALEGGAPGPTITFGEGGGVRDKIPLLRMTKGPEKEFVWCVVEKNEADDIFGGMARAGKITEPGRGFMYSIPVRSGLINVSSTVSSSGYGANMDQIIAALDDLKGGKEWRTAAETESSENRALKTTFLENLVGLYCIVPRDHYEDVYDSVLDGGAPGVSTNFGIMVDSGSDDQNEEWAVVYTSVGPDNVDSLREKLTAKMESLEINRFAFYSLPIPRALTYLGG